MNLMVLLGSCGDGGHVAGLLVVVERIATGHSAHDRFAVGIAGAGLTTLLRGRDAAARRVDGAVHLRHDFLCFVFEVLFRRWSCASFTRSGGSQILGVARSRVVVTDLGKERVVSLEQFDGTVLFSRTVFWYKITNRIKFKNETRLKI